MDAAVIRLGPSDGLRFELKWLGPASDSAAEATRGQLAVFVGRSLVWGEVVGAQVVGIEWTWVDLLEHLARVWPRIAWEQADPLALGVRADRLRMEAENLWERTEPVEADEWALWQYEDAHDLAAALQGAWPQPFWLQREGTEMIVVGGAIEERVPHGDALRALSALGDEIAVRLRALEDARSRKALDSWGRRSSLTPREYVQVATGLAAETIESVLGGQSESTAFEFSETGEDSELLAAARLAGPGASTVSLRGVLAAARGTPLRDTPALDALSEEAHRVLRSCDRPYAQGYALAQWLRERLGVKRGERVHPASYLEEWGVHMGFVQIDSPHLDAVCVWGSKHGPALIVNTMGRHIQGEGGQMATLAHEICHLLVDRQGALPLAEVLGGRVPVRVERRARAFAAEFLLPRALAAEEFRVGTPLSNEVDRVCDKYGISRELLAWQLRNSDVDLPSATWRHLGQHVSGPWM